MLRHCCCAHLFACCRLLLTLVDATADTTACERALAVAKRSKCPSSHWKDALSPWLWANSSFRGDAPLVYVNAGANKGFAVAEFLQRFHDEGGSSPSNREWHKSIKSIKPSGMFGCGMCSACKDAYPAASVRRNVSVRVFAFELLKPNHWLLTKLFEKHRVPGRAYHAAVSNYSGTAYAPTGVRTGQEWTSAEMGEQQQSGGGGGGGGGRISSRAPWHLGTALGGAARQVAKAAAAASTTKTRSRAAPPAVRSSTSRGERGAARRASRWCHLECGCWKVKFVLATGGGDVDGESDDDTLGPR